MLKVRVHNLPQGIFSTYEAAISYLASNTIVYYSGQEYRPRGEGFGSYDVSEVCCWLSEQPLRNGMRLCTFNNGSERIGLIHPPVQEEPGEIITEVDSTPLIANNLLLISADCYEGLKKSLDEFDKGVNQLIKNPLSPNDFVADPWNFRYYIWPNLVYTNLGRTYSSQDCFIYTKKLALIQKLAVQGESGDDMAFEQVYAEQLKEFLFIEANPFLPIDMYVMAQNTIRLFRLNSRYYDHVRTQRFNCLEYNTSNGEHEYDDLRLEGRMQAYNQARKSLNQLRTMHTLMVDQETLEVFISQYKILMELTGFTSVWATVFNEGEDPGGFNDIMGVAAPVTPVTPVSTPPNSGDSITTKDIVDLNDIEKVVEIVIDQVEDLKTDPEFTAEAPEVITTKKRIYENIKEATDGCERPTKKLKLGDLAGTATDNAATASVLTGKNAVTCSDSFRLKVNRKLNLKFQFCAFPREIFGQ